MQEQKRAIPPYGMPGITPGTPGTPAGPSGSCRIIPEISNPSPAAPGRLSTEDSGFLRTDRGKTNSNAIGIPTISLPKGGGAIKAIDEKFTVNALNGTAALSI